MNRPFNAWLAGAPIYIPPLFGGAVLILVAWPSLVATAGLGFLLVGTVALLVYRDPSRPVCADADAIVCPADGNVSIVEDLADTPYYDGPCKRVSIRTSLIGVRVSRAPFSGEVIDCGAEPSQGDDVRGPSNTSARAIRYESGKGPITVRHVPRGFGDRLLTSVTQGTEVFKGERIGLVSIGARTELYLPMHAQVCVGPKQSVRAGTTVVARIS